MPDLARVAFKDRLSLARAKYGASTCLVGMIVAAVLWLSVPFWPFWQPDLPLPAVLSIYLVWDGISAIGIHQFGVKKQEFEAPDVQAFLEPDGVSFVTRLANFLLFAVLAIVLVLGLIIHWAAFVCSS